MKFSRLSRFVSPIVLLMLIFDTFASPPVKADEQDQQIRQVVEWFAQVGAGATGLPINAQEIDLTTEMVKCAVKGGPAGDCAEKALISTLVKQVGLTGTTGDAINGVVGCLVTGGSAGDCAKKAIDAIPIPTELRPMVGCIADGGALNNCTKKYVEGQVLSQIPTEVRPIAECIIQTTDPKCVTKAIVNNLTSKLPEPTKILVNCLGNSPTPAAAANCAVPANAPKVVQELVGCATANGANIQQCATKFATNQILSEMPEGPGKDAAAKAAECIGQKNVQECGSGVVKQEISSAEAKGIQEALALIAKLKPDDPIPHDLSNGMRSGASENASLQNIIKVVEAVQKGNISEIIIYGGPEMAKIAGKIILDIFVGPLAPLLAPVVDAMIQNDVDAAKAGLRDLYKGDAVGLAETAFKWYETQMIQGGCALLPNGGFHDTVCGGAADAINWVADTAGGAAKDILKIGKDILDKLGLWDPLDDAATTVWKGVQSVLDDVGHFLGIGDDEKKKVVKVCVTQPAEYFASQVLGNCFSAATARAAAGSPDSSGVVAACEGYYGQCSADKVTVHNNCQKMADALNVAAGKAADQINAAAKAYTDSGGAAIYAAKINNENVKDGNLPPNRERDLCSASFWNDMAQSYATACAQALTSPHKNGTAPFLSASFSTPNNACPIPTGASAARQACLNAIRASTSKGLFGGGPDSAFCKKQQQEVALEQALHPCDVKWLPSIFTPSGMEIKNFKCAPRAGDRIRPMNAEAKIRIPWSEVSIFVDKRLHPFPYDRDTRLVLSLPGSFIPKVLRPLPNLPNGGRIKPPGKGIASLPNGSSASRIKPFPVSRDPVVTLPAPRENGGRTKPVLITNTPHGGVSSSAMDNAAAAATGVGLGGVAGNAGGPSIGRMQSGAGPSFGTGPKVQPPKDSKVTGVPSGGTGGIGLVNGASGNAPVSGTKSKMGSSVDRPVTPPSKSKSAPSPDPFIEYGGCSRCNSGGFVQPK